MFFLAQVAPGPIPAAGSWLQVLQLIVLALLAILGLYMNSKFAKFEKEYVQPLSSKLTEESSSRAIAIEKMNGLINGLGKTVNSLEGVAGKMDADARSQAIELGQHREQIATLFRQKERLETRVEVVENNVERRRFTRSEP